MKDAEIVKESAGAVLGAKWYFFRSAYTGKVGAAQRVLDLLDANKIPYEILN